MRMRTAIVMGMWIQVLGGCTPTEVPPDVQDVPTTQAMAFPVLKPPVRTVAWRSYERSIDETKIAETAELRALLSARAQLNRAALEEDGQSLRPETEKHLMAFEKIAWEYAKATTPGQYIQVGRRLGLTVIRTLKRRQSEGRTLGLAKDDVDEPDATLIGPFARHASDVLLLPFPSEDMTNECLLQAIFMQNWGQSISQRISTEDYTLPMERICWLKWLVERSPNARFEQRLDAVSELTALTGYPAEYNRGALLFRVGRRKDALKAFKASPRPEAKEAVRRLSAVSVQ